MDYRMKTADNYRIRSFDGIDYESLKKDETIFSLANGMLGIRGNFVEGYGKPEPSPLLINGIYNYYPFHYEENYRQFPQSGQTIILLPDASLIEIVTDDGAINGETQELVTLDRTLDMMQGGTIRTAMYRTRQGHRFTLVEERKVAITDNVVIIRLSIASPDYAGAIHLRSHLSMPFVPQVESLDPRLSQPRIHLTLQQIHCGSEHAEMITRTTKSNIDVYVAITHDLPFRYEESDAEIVGTFQTNLEPGQTLSVTKYMCYSASNLDPKPQETIHRLINSRQSIHCYEALEAKANREFWNRSDVDSGEPDLTRAIRYNLYQLDHSGGNDTNRSIAAKGISGDGYEGHYFWDTETYMLPFFLFTNPAKAANLLRFRHRHLNKAREEARNLGIERGAKIPWRTIDGTETSPYYPAGSAQIHINSDIAFAVIRYYQMTLDEAFMAECGVELLVETAIFLLDWGHYANDRFHLDCVTGPDEFSAIVNDNYYTNRMVKIHFQFTADYVLSNFVQFENQLTRWGYTLDDVNQLKIAGNQMALEADPIKNIWLQDEHFTHKKELDLAAIPADRFPLLLHYHPLFIYRHQVLKQADTVLAMVLAGEAVDDRYRSTVHYYLDRTTHDSSLSKCAYGIALLRLNDSKQGFAYLRDVAELDLYDLKRYTKHGLHAANMGGSFLILLYGIFGVYAHDRLEIHPIRIDGLKKASIRLLYRGVKVGLNLDQTTLKITVDRPITLWIDGLETVVQKHHSCEVKRLTK
jgi:alpha,alpha-trehalose phosphorylase